MNTAYYDYDLQEYMEGHLSQPTQYWIIRMDEENDTPFNKENTAKLIFNTQKMLGKRVDLIEYWNDTTDEHTAIETLISSSH